MRETIKKHLDTSVKSNKTVVEAYLDFLIDSLSKFSSDYADMEEEKSSELIIKNKVKDTEIRKTILDIVIDALPKSKIDLNFEFTKELLNNLAN